MNEEPFGPVALMRPFDTFDEAIEQANRLPFGLAAYASPRTAAARTCSAMRSRAAWSGSTPPCIGGAGFAVRRGQGHSGHGSEDGPEGLDACLVTKAIHQA